MNITSNYGYYSSSYLNAKKINSNSSESEESSKASSQNNLQAEFELAVGTSTESEYFQAKANEEQSYYSNFILMSSQPLNKTLTNYRDIYPNIIGFTAKTQSSLSSLRDEYMSKIHGLAVDFSNCKTLEEFKTKMKELKSKISQLMNEYNAKYKDIGAIASALPTLSDVRNKLVGSDIDMHDELDTILKNVSDYNDKKKMPESKNTNSAKLFGELDEAIITKKIQDLQEKNKEYKNELKKAQIAQNQVKIEENETLINATEKMINVYLAVISGFQSTKQQKLV